MPSPASQCPYRLLVSPCMRHRCQLPCPLNPNIAQLRPTLDVYKNSDWIDGCTLCPTRANSSLKNPTSYSQPRTAFLATMLRIRISTRCSCSSSALHHAAARLVVAQRKVRVRAAFDERPTEPITPAQQQISQELMNSMEKSIGEALEADSVSVKDVFGDHQHVCISVVSSQFEGKTAVKRQRLVYQVCDLHSFCLSVCRVL